MPIDAARNVDAAPAAVIDGASYRTALAPYNRTCGARGALTTPACRRTNAINRTEVVFLYRSPFSHSSFSCSTLIPPFHHIIRPCDVVKTQIARETARFHTSYYVIHIHIVLCRASTAAQSYATRYSLKQAHLSRPLCLRIYCYAVT